jgi:hypothetical protein
VKLAMRTANRPAALVCFVVSVLTVAGCTTEQPATGGVDVTLDATALDSVVRTESYTDDERRLDRAERELTQRCMAARGLPYSSTRHTTVAAQDDEWHPDMESRRRAGYGLHNGYAPGAGQAPLSDSDREVERWPADRQAAYQTALMGTDGKRAWIDVRRSQRFTFPTDGCIAESRAQLYGAPDIAARVFYVLQNIARGIDHDVRADPAYKAAIADWASCMERHGYQYSSPSQAKADLGQTYRRLGVTPSLREYEVAVAVMDATCAYDARLTATASTLAKKYAEMLPGNDRADLRSLAALRAVAVDRAMTVLVDH